MDGGGGGGGGGKTADRFDGPRQYLGSLPGSLVRHVRGKGRERQADQGERLRLKLNQRVLHRGGDARLEQHLHGRLALPAGAHLRGDGVDGAGEVVHGLRRATQPRPH